MSSENLPLAFANLIQNVNVQLKNGSVAAPSLTFTTNLTTGLFAPVSNNIVVAAAGLEITRFTPTSIEFSKPICMTDQAPIAPVVATLGCLYKKPGNNGLFWNTLGGGEVNVIGGAAIAWPILATDAVGNAGAPSFAFNADPDTGMYLNAVGTLALTVGGAARLSLTNALATLAVPLNLGANSIAGATTVTASGAVTGGSLIAGNLTLSANTIAAVGPLTLSSNTDQVLLTANPTVALGATTKQYVDAIASGLTLKPAVRLKTVALLPVHAAAGAGVGKTLTMAANGILTIDGVATVLNDRILVDDTGTVTGVDRGIYAVTTAGTAGTAAILTRATDADNDAEVISGMFMFVSEGVASQNNGFALVTNDPIIVDVTAQSYTQFTGLSSDTASNVGVAGVSVFKQKTLNDFEFNSVNAASARITVVLDAGNNEIDIDVSEGNVDHNSLNNLTAGDPHTQYMLKAGTAMTGNLDMGTNSITNSSAVTASGAVTGGSLASGNLTLSGNTVAAVGAITLSSSTNQVLLPANPTVALGAATMQYVDAVATASLPIAGGTMTGPLLADDAGTAALPAISFDTDANTGMYRPAPDTIGLSTNGTLRLTVSNTAVTSAVDIAMGTNSITGATAITASAAVTGGTLVAGNTTISTNAMTTVGAITLSSSTNQVLLTADPTVALGAATMQYVDGFLPLAGGTLTGALILDSAVSPLLPDISFTGDPNTGFYLPAADSIGMSTGGVLRATLNTNLVLATNTNLVFTEPGGADTITLAAPVIAASYTLTLPTTDGNPLEVLTTNGTGALSWAAVGAGAALPLAGGTMTGAILADVAGTAALPAIAFDTDPNTGIYRPAADSIGVSTNGVLRTTVNNSLLKLNSVNTEYTAVASAAVANATALGDFVLFFDSTNANNLSYKNSAGAVVDVETAGGDNLGNHTATTQIQATVAGTAAAPSITFTTDLDTGIYRTAADSIGLSTNGVLRLTVSNTAVTPAVDIAMGTNSITGATAITASAAITGGTLVAGNTTISTNAMTTVGAITLSSSTNQVLLTADPTVALGAATMQYVDGFLPLAGGTLTGALLADDAGSAALPAIAFDTDPNTGIYRTAADSIGLSTNGVLRLTVNNTAVTPAVDIAMGTNSITGATAITASAAVTGGTLVAGNTTISTNAMTTVGAITLSSSTNQVLLTADPTVALGAATMQYVDGFLPLTGGTLTGALLVDDGGSAALPAIAFDTDPNTGIYRTAADSIGLSTGGTLRLTVSNTAVTPAVDIAMGTNSITGATAITASAAITGGSLLAGNLTASANTVSAVGAITLSSSTDQVLLTADPTAALGSATKQYVDNIASGLSVRAPVRVKTDALLPVHVAAGAGIGKTLTVTAVGILTVDGVATVLNDRILVDDSGTVTAADRGIYTVTTQGTAGVAAILTRATDADTDAEVIAGMFMFATEGTTFADTGHVLTTNDPIVVDTTGQSYSQFTGVSSDTAANVGATGVGVFVNKVGNTFRFKNITGGTGLTVTNDAGNNEIDITLALGTIDHNSLNNLTTANPHTQYVLLAGGTMTGALLVDDAGSAALPAIAFDTDPNTGMYRPAPDSIGLSTGGTLRLTVSNTAVTPAVNIAMGTNSITGATAITASAAVTGGTLVAGNTTISTNAMTTVGAITLSSSTNQVLLTADPTVALGAATMQYVDGFLPLAGGTLTGALLLDSATSPLLPDISFTGDPNTGFYSPAADSIGVSTNGVLRTTINNSLLKLNSVNTEYTALAAAAVANATALGDFVLFFDSSNANNLSYKNSAGAVVDVETAGNDNLGNHIATAQIQATVAGTAAAPSLSFATDLDTGMYRPAADTIGLSTNGVLRLTVSNTAVTPAVNIAMGTNSITGATAITASAAVTGGTLVAGNTTISTNAMTTVGAITLSSSTNQVLLTADPTVALGAATMQYVDGFLPLAGGTLTGALLLDSATSPLLPDISFTGDPNTGFYSPAADSIGVSTNGVLRTTINNSLLKLNSVNTEYTALASAAVANATALGDFVLFFDSTNANNLSYKNSAGAVVDVETAGGDNLGNHTATTQIQATVAGSAAAPSITFTTDLDTGIYRTAADSIGLSTNGVLRLTVSNTAVTPAVDIAMGTNSITGATAVTASAAVTGGTLVAGNTTISTNAMTTVGAITLSSSTNQVLLTADPTVALGAATMQYVDGFLPLVGGTLTGALLVDDAGSAALPAIAFDTDPNTGIYRTAADSIGLSTNGVLRLTVSNTAVTPAVDIAMGTNSITGATAITASAAVTGGTLVAGNTTISTNAMTTVGAITLSSSTNQVLLTADPTVALGAATMQYVDGFLPLAGGTLTGALLADDGGTAVTPAIAFDTDPNTGIYRTAADSIGLSTGGTLRLTVSNTAVTPAVDIAMGTNSITGATAITASAAVTGGTLVAGNTTISTNALTTVGAITLSSSTNQVLLTADPTAALGSATKQYVDSIASGLSVRAPVRVKTDALLPVHVAAGAGIGKTLTVTAVGILTVDGVATVLNDRILVDDSGTVTAADRGIYTVTTQGTAGVAAILTRATDADTDAEVIAGMFMFATEGTTFADTGHVLTTNDPIVVDTTGQSYSQFTGVSSDTASNVGATGVGVFVSKVGNNFRFKNITGGTGLTVTDDAGNNEIDLTLALGAIDHNSLNNLTTANPHTQYVLLAGGTMTGALLVDDAGSAALPAISFDTDPNTGIYRTAADSIGLSTGGTLRLTVSNTAVTPAVDIAMGTNSITGATAITASAAVTGGTLVAGNTTISTNAMTTVGAITLSSSTNQVLLTADPTVALGAATMQYVDGFLPLAGGTLTGALLLDSAASAAAPDISFTGDPNTGFYLPAADSIGMSTNGVLRATLNTNLVLATNTNLVFTEAGGADTITITAPAIGASYTLTLPINDGAPAQVLTTDGAGILSWAAGTGAFLALDGTTSMTGPINASTGTALLPSVHLNGDVNTGLYQAAADSISISTNGTQRLTVNNNGLLLNATAAPGAVAAGQAAIYTETGDPNKLMFMGENDAVRELTNQDYGHKQAVRVATSSNVGLTGAGPVIIGGTVDGVVLAAADRVLVKNQAATATNGVYIVSTVAATAPARASGFNSLDQFVLGTKVLITEGNISGGKTFYTSAEPAVLGTNPWLWTPVGHNHTEYLAGEVIVAGDIVAGSLGGNVFKFTAPFSNSQTIILAANTEANSFAAGFDDANQTMLIGYREAADNFVLRAATVAADGTLTPGAEVIIYAGYNGEEVLILNVGAGAWCVFDKLAANRWFVYGVTVAGTVVTDGSAAGVNFGPAANANLQIDAVYCPTASRVVAVIRSTVVTVLDAHVITMAGAGAPTVGAATAILPAVTFTRDIHVATYVSGGADNIVVAVGDQYRAGIVNIGGSIIDTLGNILTEPIAGTATFLAAANPGGLVFSPGGISIECHRNAGTYPTTVTYPTSLGVSGTDLVFNNSTAYAFGGYSSTSLMYSTMAVAHISTGTDPITGRLTVGMSNRGNGDDLLLFGVVHPTTNVDVGMSQRQSTQWLFEDTTNEIILMSYRNSTTGDFVFSVFNVQDFHDFLGIAQNNAGIGETVHVAVRGSTSTAHTGLTPNTKYYIDSNNPTVLTTSITLGAVAGLAISATDMILTGPGRNLGIGVD